MGITVLIGEENSGKTRNSREIADKLKLDAVFDSGDFEKDLTNAKATITEMWINSYDAKGIRESTANPLYGKNVLIITGHPVHLKSRLITVVSTL